MAVALAGACAAGRRRGWPDPAASSLARGGGSRIWWPRRPATALAAPSSSSVAGKLRGGAAADLVRPPPPLPGRRPWRVPARGRGGEQIPGKQRGGAAAAGPPGAAAEQEQGRPEARIEGLRVDFLVVEGFFCKTSRICTIWTVCVLDRTAGKNG